MEKATLPQFDITTFESQIFWLIIVFVCFYFYVKIFIAPYFFSEIESRDLFISNGLSEIKKMQRKAEYLSDDFNEKIQAAHLKASDILQDAKKTADGNIEAMRQSYNQSNSQKIEESVALLEEDFRQTKQNIYLNIDDLTQQAFNKIKFT